MDFAALERTTLLVDAGSGLVFLALGLWVLALKPRRAVTLALGTYATGLGLNVLVDNLGNGALGWLGPRWEAIELVAVPTVAAALVALGLLFPRPLPWRSRAVAAAAAVGALQLAGIPFVLARARTGFAAAVDSVYFVAYAATWFALVVFALRYARAEAPGERRALAIVSVALGLEMGIRTGIAAIATTGGTVEPTTVGAAVLAVLAIVGVWLRNTTRGPTEARRAARNVALFFPALLLGGAAFAAATDPARAFNLGPMGLSRIAGVLLLAWAILRGLLPGVDARVRWTLSKSTLAAVFIAVFFVASEGAQILFGAGNEWVGLAAAGALVFALSPLQRAAERLAERAVPVATPLAPTAPAASREESYKRAVRLALRGGITRDEEVHLHEVAEHMGIGAGRAMALRVEVERERTDDGAPEVA